MSIEEYLARVRNHGFTIFKKNHSYLVLQGADGEFTGIPNPDHLTPEQRVEELTCFLKRNTIG